MPADLKQRIKELAAVEGRSINKQIIRMLYNALNRQH
jgi:hypothetical protein